MEFPPSQEYSTPDGRRWRKCAGAAIVNSAGHLLVGERIKIAGAWNCPQGGMDASSREHSRPETVLEAAAREAFEEVGLKVGEHIVPIAAMDDEQAVRYAAGGWLAQEGYAGQQLHWALFQICDVVGDSEPSHVCTLGGLGGEEPEFARVEWRPFETVIAAMWANKRAPYEALMRWALPLLEQRAQLARGIDFTGTWQRHATLNDNVVEALVARGLDVLTAQREASKLYVQEWARHDSLPLGDWMVTTVDVDGQGAYRAVVYALGDWEETLERPSVLFGDASAEQPDELLRRTGWVALHPEGFAHTTWSSRVNGVAEITARWLRHDGAMVVARTFLADGRRPVVCEEIFQRQPPEPK